MRRPRGAGPARVVAALAVVAALLGVGAPPALAAAVTFGTPAATASFDQSIEFSVPVTLTAAPARVELELRFPDSLGPYLVEVAPPSGGGSTTLRWTWDMATDGHLVPNTTIRARWVVTPAGTGASSVTSAEIPVTYADTRFDWQTATGDVVRVHWSQGGAAFGARALRIADDAVARTADLLGVTESEPIDFYVYADSTAFRDALGPGTREWVGGQAHADIRTLFALITPSGIDDAWVGVVIPHELVHLVFDTAVRNPYRFPPAWVNEGLAVYLSEGFTASDRQLVARAASSGTLMPLGGLVGQFPTDVDRTYLAYAESVSAIDYLVRVQGQDALIALVRAYADGRTDDEAFRAAIGQDVATFQAGWLGDLGAGEPVRYGPQPEPAGPLPPGWSATEGGGPTGSPVASPALPGTPAPSSGPGQGSAAGGTDPVLIGVVVLVLIVGAVVAGRLVRRRRSARGGPA